MHGRRRERADRLRQLGPSGRRFAIRASRDTLAPKVRIAPRSVRASKRGTVKVAVTCPVGELRCKVDLRLKRGVDAVARKVATIRGGRTRNIELSLAQAARVRLAQRRRMEVTAVAKVKDAAGNGKRVTRKITLRRHSS